MSNQLLERPLPSNEEGEQIILGSILLDGRAMEFATAKLEPDDFYNFYHRKVFSAMVQLARESRPIIVINILEVWKSEGVDVDTVGGAARLTDLTTGLYVFRDNELKDIINTVKEHSIARKLVRTCNNTIEDILAGSEPIITILERSEAKVLGLSGDIHVEDKRTEKPFSDLLEIVPDMRQQFVDYHSGKTTGVATGFSKVDNLLDGGGLQDGGLYLVGAAEKTGKTSLVLDWIYNISAVHKAGRSLVSTGEMSKITMAKRIYSSHTGIPYWKFRPGLYDSPGEMTYTKALEGLDRFGTIPIAISDKLHNVSQVKRHFRRQVEAGYKSNDPNKKVRVGVIDYLQLFELGTNVKISSRADEVSKVSREFKLLATELEIPIIAISSLNRLSLGPVPDPANLRESGNLGYDAEAIFFLYNPAYIPGQPYTPTEVTPMQLILSRQRNGPTGTISLMFIGPYMQFMQIDDYERLMGPKDTDNVVPKSQGQDMMEKEGLMKLWE